MLARDGENVCALANSCSHLGGPLAAVTLKEHSAVCPWHGSEFALKDGHVINGPATHRQPTLLVREENGEVEVKLR
jgi:nitrite reductase/ring-hydroxylating ferredoxin subunit